MNLWDKIYYKCEHVTRIWCCKQHSNQYKGIGILYLDLTLDTLYMYMLVPRRTRLD